MGAASSYDGYTSAQFGPGIVEANPARSGKFAVSRGIGLKAAVHAGVGLAEWATFKWAGTPGSWETDKFFCILFTSVNSGGAAAFTAVGLHNNGLTRSVK
jgi:hypothetical protein